jgi:hypothetical protein
MRGSIRFMPRLLLPSDRASQAQSGAMTPCDSSFNFLLPRVELGLEGIKLPRPFHLRPPRWKQTLIGRRLLTRDE